MHDSTEALALYHSFMVHLWPRVFTLLPVNTGIMQIVAKWHKHCSFAYLFETI